MLFSFAACSDPSKENSGENENTTAGTTPATDETEAEVRGDPTPIDEGWIKLDMPFGYIDESNPDYVSIICEADPNKTINIARDILLGVTLDVLIEDQVAQSKGSLGDPFEAAGFEWNVINLVSNGKDGRRLFAQIDEMNYLRVSLFDLTEQDEAVQQVLNSLVIDMSK